jgi:hypothetical protein
MQVKLLIFMSFFFLHYLLSREKFVESWVLIWISVLCDISVYGLERYKPKLMRTLGLAKFFRMLTVLPTIYILNLKS